MLTVRLKRLTDTAKIPIRGSTHSGGWDLYANIDWPIKINPHETIKIGTGLAMEIPFGNIGLICARSGLATKKGLAPANKVGIDDPDYRGEIIVALHNHSTEVQEVTPQERIAQLIIIPFVVPEFLEVDELNETDRGSGGFGSTGIV